MSKHNQGRQGNPNDLPHHLDSANHSAARRHLAFGWWALLIYLAMGIALEGMHGFKIGYLLDASNETRRLLWRLGHAHGTLLALVNIAFAITIKVFGSGGGSAGSSIIASRCLIGATILLPAGFLLGGITIYAGDPGLPILLVPIGAALLVVGVFLAARLAGRTPNGDRTRTSTKPDR